jgi:hypothetical protein
MVNINKKSSFTKIMLLTAAFLAFTCSYEINETGSYYCEEDSYIPENAIEIIFGGEGGLKEHYENGISIVQNGDNAVVLSLSNDYNLLVSGITENGSLKIYGNHRMGLYLKSASIVNPSGPAINIQNRGETSVHLVGGTENYIADGENYEIAGGEDAKGTFFSEGKVSFSGCGSLEVNAKHAHAIAVDNDIEFEGGKITARTIGIKSHGVSAHSAAISKNANIKIETSGNGAKGIKSDGFMAVRGGTTYIKTSGGVHIDNSANPPDTSSATGIKADGSMEISGGTLVVKAYGAGAKGINVGGNLTVPGGRTRVSANDDGVKVHGNFLLSDADFCAWSSEKQDTDYSGLTLTGDKCVTGF